jgi:hypothetical protein
MAVTEIAGSELTGLQIANYSLSLLFILIAVGAIVGSVRALVRWLSGRGQTPVHA